MPAPAEALNFGQQIEHWVWIRRMGQLPTGSSSAPKQNSDLPFEKFSLLLGSAGLGRPRFAGLRNPHAALTNLLETPTDRGRDDGAPAVKSGSDCAVWTIVRQLRKRLRK
jgi:hypothetical protein